MPNTRFRSAARFSTQTPAEATVPRALSEHTRSRFSPHAAPQLSHQRSSRGSGRRQRPPGCRRGAHLAPGTPMPYRVSTAAPPRPRLCCSATFAPGTWRLPARPRSCQQSSAHCARPGESSTERGCLHELGNTADISHEHPFL